MKLTVACGQGFVHAPVAAVLLRFAGLDELWEDAEPDPPGSRARVVVAKGTPLSVRMRCGSPNSLKTRVKSGLP